MKYAGCISDLPKSHVMRACGNCMPVDTVGCVLGRVFEVLSQYEKAIRELPPPKSMSMPMKRSKRKSAEELAVSEYRPPKAF
eukprot:3749571-Pyramimonas_sp.AAC.2